MLDTPPLFGTTMAYSCENPPQANPGLVSKYPAILLHPTEVLLQILASPTTFVIPGPAGNASAFST
jgi:hypothetical protein